MKHTNTHYRILASTILAAFIANTIAPTLQYTFAADTQYYVDATLGSDANDGLTPATPWQTLTHVNSQVFSQGDTVSFLCGESWTGVLDGVESGILGNPIRYNSYGPGCTGSNQPQFENILVIGASNVVFDNIVVSSPTGTGVIIDSSSDITLSNARVNSTDSAMVVLSGSTSVTVQSNIFNSGSLGVVVGNSSATIQGNTFSNLSDTAIRTTGNLAKSIINNIFSNLDQSAIIFTENTAINQNSLQNICLVGGAGCAAMKNDSSLPLGTDMVATLSDNIVRDIGTGINGGNHGLILSGVRNVTLTNNTVNNSENGIDIRNSSGITLTNNTLLFARKNSVSIVQDIPGTVDTVVMNGNRLLQRNVDYPYIEMRDETPGSGTVNFISANGNNFVTLYKPDTSYVRSVKFGGEVVEYATKSSLNTFDPSNTRFQAFGYRPYTATGSYATANLLSNPDFEIDVSGWTPSAPVVPAPTLSQNPAGSYSGGSMTITPQDPTPDALRVTNDALLSITSGQVYEVRGYLKSTSTGELNVRAYLHQSGNFSNIYSDRIAETYSTLTGRTFQFYIRANTTAADAQFTLETSNPDIALEVDEISLMRKTIVSKNTDPNEVLVFSNTGSSPILQSCPGGVPCAQYVDTANMSVGWPAGDITILAYSTAIALWNNSSNLQTVPQVSMIIDSGSIPSGTEAHITWAITGSLSSYIDYTTSTGSFTLSIGNTGDIYFEPPAGATTSTYIRTENDIGPRINQVDVTTTNTPPIVYPVTILGTEEDPTVIGTLSGVDQNPGDSVFYEKFTDPTGGSVSVSLAGTATYMPNPDFCGTDSFMYRAYDQFSNYADPVVATIQLACTNDSPTAVSDSITVTGSLTIMDVLTNDTDPDSIYEVQTFTLDGFTQPAHGSVVINANMFEYAVDVGYIGPDSFTYSFMDQSGALSTTGTVNIMVSVPNTPPTDSGASYAGTEDMVINGVFSGSDINGDILSFTVSTLPANGTVNIIGSNFTYTPTADYFGSDSFIYQTFDGSAYSSGAQIDITLSSVDDAPVANNDSYSLVQDTTLFIPVLANDTDVDTALGLLTLTGNTNPSNGTLIPTATGYLYTAGSGYTGVDSFTYRIEDNTVLLSNIATVNLTITTSNTPPMVSDLSFSVNEDAILTQTLSGSDAEMSTLTYIVDTMPSNGTLNVTSTGVFIYTPTLNYNGSDSFTYHVNDGMLDSSGATVSITVNSVNDLPSVTDGSYIIAGNSFASSGNIYSNVLTGSDLEDLILSFSAVTLPTHGILSLQSSGSYTYTPAYGYTGTDSFSFIAIDTSLGVSNTGTVTFNISGMNSAPFAYPVTIMTNEDTAIALSLSGVDPDGDIITYVIDTMPSTGALILGSAGSATYTPALNYNGTLTFTYHTSDGLLSSSVATGTIDILPVNDTPVSYPGTYSVTPNTSTNSGNSLTLMGTGTDVEGSALTYAVLTGPTNGNVVSNGSGSFTYTPNIGFNGTDSFTYTVSDGIIASTSATITLTVGTVTPPVVVVPSNPIVSGPGGGGGGGGAGSSSSSSSSENSTSFNSAPVIKDGTYVVINGTVFATNDSTGLAGQLFLMNRSLNRITPVLSGQISQTVNSPMRASISDMIENVIDAEDPAMELRKIVRIALNRAIDAEDPLDILDSALIDVEMMDTGDDDRLNSTQEYALRVLQFHQRMYENMIYRDLNAASRVEQDEVDPLDEDIEPETDQLLDDTSDEDLSDILKLLESLDK